MWYGQVESKRCKHDQRAHDEPLLLLLSLLGGWHRKERNTKRRTSSPTICQPYILLYRLGVGISAFSRIYSLDTPARDHSHHPRLGTCMHSTVLPYKPVISPAICKSSQPRVPPISSLNSTVLYISKAAACPHTSTRNPLHHACIHTQTAKRRRTHAQMTKPLPVLQPPGSPSNYSRRQKS
jgi:hypothetical protein